ncbi:transcriptional regulator, LysR family [Cognatiyoonia koreensis]|uniref:Transcriptional regulator, LysR family n=1 Tax=Cognatiyoonia koreensis TaxID=364200 RepID=A0A1I0QCR3_9RHOB|nr:LysR family transcriptional regulator [Cognatiyoonia koreensis]SEW24681.1 transcriptional regulator, LysR family [Cognatiyoonia koreensis]
MLRNLDMTALRSFVTVAESGGVTRAAGMLNLTQSAVSMQLKRLEEALGLQLLDRSARTIGLTAAGEQLVGYGQRMLALNDEIYRKLTAQEFEGELKLGVPHDIIYPTVPRVLKQVAAEFPRMRVRLISAPTLRLKEMFARGECDFILTTEDACDPKGETLISLPMVWVGAVDGVIWRERPLRIAHCTKCIFRTGVLRTLNAAGVPWEMAVDSELDNAVEAAVSADLAVTAAIEGGLPPHTVVIDHGGALPDLGAQNINLYVQQPGAHVSAAVAAIIRKAYKD